MINPNIMRAGGDGLLIVDMQVDFCPGGTLPVPDGHQVVPVLNHWLTAAAEKGIPVYASRDWHPLNHPSFLERDGQWLPHCIQESPGALFHPELNLPVTALIITKGVRFDCDQHSAFDQTGLVRQLEYDQIKRLWVGGLAQDRCILASVLDARRSLLDIVVIGAATRPYTLNGGRRALDEMAASGAEIVI